VNEILAVRRPVEFHVLSRSDAECYEPRGVEACISIGDPAAAPAQISAAFVAILRLAFNDIEGDPGPNDVLFGPEQAAEIIGFVERCPAVERIVVHCGAGVSRSPGVALGVCEAFDWPVASLERAFPGWNRHVRRVIVDYAAGQRV
jgi:predicted protein tyrosine phosphatase